jgi:hypothetical protein
VPEAADILVRLDAAIRELRAIKDAIAASKGDASSPFSTPAAANGAGESTLARLRAATVELGARISGDDRVGEACAA